MGGFHGVRAGRCHGQKLQSAGDLEGATECKKVPQGDATECRLWSMRSPCGILWKKGSGAKATCRDNLCPPATECKEMLRTGIKDSGLVGAMDMYNIPMPPAWGILWKKREAEARVPYESSLWSPVQLSH